MKKKFFAVVTAIMVLCMGTTCFAAESVTTKVATDTKGVVASEPVAEEISAAKTEAVKQVSETAKVVAVFELKDDGTAVKGADGKYEVVVKLTGVSKSDNVVVLHQKVDGNWEKLDATAGDGTVTFKTETFSPFAIVKVPAATEKKAPATGASAPIVAMLAIAAAAACIACTKKARA